ncbi:ABC transporter ATP-binding protein, partial [Kitasatospora sp. NPDC056783]
VAGVRVPAGAGAARGAEALVVRASGPAVEDLVAALVAAGVRVREVAPVVPPLEAAFLALTEQQEDGT